MSLIRAFIAIEIPAEIKQHIAEATGPLIKPTAAFVRWVPTDNFHVTLKFLGDISSNQIELLTQTLQMVGASHKPFNLQVGGLGCFPNARRPKVIWVGIKAPQELTSLFLSIEAGTQKIGYATEEKPFSPHLTIGRVSIRASNTEFAQLREKLNQTQLNFLDVAQVTHIHLYQSILQTGGAHYTQLFTAKLKT